MPHSKATSRLGKTLAALTLIGAMIATPLVASAATEAIHADNEPFNQTLYYSGTHYHSAGNSSKFALQSHTGTCGSQFKLALRSQMTGDSTFYTYWYSPGAAQSFKWWTGSYTLPAGNYQVTARNDCAGSPGALYSWTGSLTL